MKQKLFIIMMACLTIACNESTDLGAHFSTDNPGYLYLDINQAQSFDPNADHGKVSRYQVTIVSSALNEDIVLNYPPDTKEVTFEGFPGGSTVNIKIEVININDICVRRGYSGDVTIIGGQNVSATITVNNVPIFANVRDGALVYNNRFAPKIFAPGEISFQLFDDYTGSMDLIEDLVLNLTSFSISKSIENSVMTINAPMFTLGRHDLMVEDPNTNEASKISITVYDGTNKKALTTTAGNYLGTLSNKTSSLPIVHDYQLGNL